MTSATDQNGVRSWRLQQLRALGFSEEEAELLADASHVDLEQVRQMVRAGAPLEIVARIVL